MAILARLAFDTPVELDDVTYEGITEIQPDDIAYAKELGLSLKLLGVAERRDGGISVRVFPCFLYPRPPARPDRGAVQRGHGRGAGDHRDHDVRAGRGRGRDRHGGARRRRLDPLRRGPGPRSRARRSRSSATSAPSFYLHLEVADRPGVLARIAEVLGRNEVSVQSVVQRGLGDDARLVMVMHEGPETRFFAALDEIAQLDFLRAAPAGDPGDRGRVRVTATAPVAQPRR